MNKKVNKIVKLLQWIIFLRKQEKKNVIDIKYIYRYIIILISMKNI